MDVPFNSFNFHFFVKIDFLNEIANIFPMKIYYYPTPRPDQPIIN